MISLFSWNVNGIRAVLKKGEFETFMKRYQPDILCIQETKAQQEQVEIELPGYFEYWNSAHKKGYSGTAIFSKIKPLKVTNGFPEDLAKKYKLLDSQGRNSEEEGRIIDQASIDMWRS